MFECQPPKWVFWPLHIWLEAWSLKWYLNRNKEKFPKQNSYKQHQTVQWHPIQNLLSTLNHVFPLDKSITNTVNWTILPTQKKVPAKPNWCLSNLYVGGNLITAPCIPWKTFLASIYARSWSFSLSQSKHLWHKIPSFIRRYTI